MRTRNITLNDLETFVLSFIMDEAVHGYHLMQNLKAHAQLFFEIGDSTVYNILRKLEKNGWVKSTEEKSGNYPSRKKYSITRSGKRILLTTIESSCASSQLTISHMMNFISSRHHFTPERYSHLFEKKISQLTSVKQSFTHDTSVVDDEAASTFLSGSIENELYVLNMMHS